MFNVKEMLKEGHDVILDRYWPSEVCYGPIMGRGNHYWTTALELIKEIKKLNHVYIFCNSEYAWSRYEQGHTDPAHSLTKEQYEQIANNYLQLKYELKEYIEYNVETHGTRDNITEFISSIENFFKLRHQSNMVESVG